jgi:hypothetical protein
VRPPRETPGIADVSDAVEQSAEAFFGLIPHMLDEAIAASCGQEICSHP